MNELFWYVEYIFMVENFHEAGRDFNIVMQREFIFKNIYS